MGKVLVGGNGRKLQGMIALSNHNGKLQDILFIRITVSKGHGGKW